MASMMDLRRNIALNEPHVETASGAVANFKTDMKSNLVGAKIYFQPIQDGTGTPSPDNVRVLSGRSGINVYVGGINLYNQSDDLPGYISASGVVTSDSSSAHSPLIPVNQNMVVTFSGNGYYAGAGNKRLHAYDKDGNWVKQLGYQNVPANTSIAYRVSSVIPEGIAYVALSFFKSDTNRMLTSFWNDTTNYYPFNILQTIAVDWSDVAGTLYGGYVDLVAGEVVKTMGFIHFDGSEDWRIYDGGTADWMAPKRPSILGVQPSNGIYEAIISDKLNGTTDWSPRLYHGLINNGGHFLFGAPEELSTKEAVSAWLQEIGGIDVVYPLVEPVHYSLTPQNIKSLSGTSNIYSNGNDQVDVSYWTHKSLLPSEYQLVDYIECTGRNARFDTGVPGNDSSLVFDFTYMPLAHYSYAGNFGNYADENTKCWRLIFAQTNTRHYLFSALNRKAGSATAINAVSSETGSIVNKKSHIRLSYGLCEIDSEDGFVSRVTESADETEAISTKNICIGSVSTTNTSGYATKARFYGSFKIFKQNELIRDYYPCVRLSDNTAGFFDVVNRTFNPSIGSVDFIAGND